MAFRMRLIAGSLFCAFAVLALAGCGSGGHQVISSNEACSSCHSSEKPQYESVQPAVGDNVVECGPGTKVNVVTNGKTAVLCSVIFTSEDGSRFVPVMASNLGTSDTSLEASEGVWAVVADEGDSSHGVVLVVNPGADSSAQVNIQL